MLQSLWIVNQLKYPQGKNKSIKSNNLARGIDFMSKVINL